MTVLYGGLAVLVGRSFDGPRKRHCNIHGSAGTKAQRRNLISLIGKVVSPFASIHCPIPKLGSRQLSIHAGFTLTCVKVCVNSQSHRESAASGQDNKQTRLSEQIGRNQETKTRRHRRSGIVATDYRHSEGTSLRARIGGTLWAALVLHPLNPPPRHTRENESFSCLLMSF